VDNFGPIFEKESLGRWVSAEDNSGDKTSTIQEVDRRHGSLPRKLELEKFEPSVTAPDGCALARKLRNHAGGGVCEEVGVCRQRAGSEDLHPVGSLESACTGFGGKSPDEIVCLLDRTLPVDEFVVRLELACVGARAGLLQRCC
jgi:hypothetical protein